MTHSFLKILHRDRHFLLSRHFLQLLLHSFQLSWKRIGLQFRTRTGFIDQIDRLIRQETVSDIPVRQLDSFHNGVFRNLHAVMLFITVPQPLDD